MGDETKYTGDGQVNRVIHKHVHRAVNGLNKYGVTTDRTDVSLVEWLNHAQDEAMDAAVYLEKLKKVLVRTGVKFMGCDVWVENDAGRCPEELARKFQDHMDRMTKAYNRENKQ